MPRLSKLENAHLYLLGRAGHIVRPAAGATASQAVQDFSYCLDLLLAG